MASVLGRHVSTGEQIRWNQIACCDQNAAKVSKKGSQSSLVLLEWLKYIWVQNTLYYILRYVWDIDRSKTFDSGDGQEDFWSDKIRVWSYKTWSDQQDNSSSY